MVFDADDGKEDGKSGAFEKLVDKCLDDEMMGMKKLLARVRELRAKGCTVNLDGKGTSPGGGQHRRLQISIGPNHPALKCGDMNTLNRRVSEVNSACCATKAQCPHGLPLKCLEECTLVFDPFFNECRALLELTAGKKLANQLEKVAETCAKLPTAPLLKEIAAAQCP